VKKIIIKHWSLYSQWESARTRKAEQRSISRDNQQTEFTRCACGMGLMCAGRDHPADPVDGKIQAFAKEGGEE